MTKKISTYGTLLKDIYETEFSKHGESGKSLFNPKMRFQHRFPALTGIGIKDGDSVLDVGCGFAYFYKCAQKAKLQIKYTGFDVSEPMIQVCRKHYPECRFDVVDILELGAAKKWDWVVLSGVFNLVASSSQTRHWKWVRDMIKQMFALSKKGVAFDFMTSYVDYTQKNAFHMNPGKIYDYCRKEITPRINIISDYMLFEYTVHLYKNIKHNDLIYQKK